MTGEEMKIYLKQSGIPLATIAEGLGISPQNQKSEDVLCCAN